MPQHAQSHLNITFFEADDTLTHWTGSPSGDGGELKMVDVSPMGGPPTFDFDTTGNDRSPKTFTISTKIVGATKAAQDAFVARYHPGKVIKSSSIAGLTPGFDYVIQSANPKHNDGEEASTLELKLHEVGATASS